MLTTKLNDGGPKTDPWGTPEGIAIGDDMWFNATTRILFFSFLNILITKVSFKQKQSKSKQAQAKKQAS